jgi:hypothetical protein
LRIGRRPRRRPFRAGNAGIMRVSLNSRYTRAADVADDVAKMVDRIAVRAATPSAQHRPKYMVPKCRADTVVSGRKSVMALMMLQQ